VRPARPWVRPPRSDLRRRGRRFSSFATTSFRIDRSKPRLIQFPASSCSRSVSVGGRPRRKRASTSKTGRTRRKLLLNDPGRPNPTPPNPGRRRRMVAGGGKPRSPGRTLRAESRDLRPVIEAATPEEVNRGIHPSPLEEGLGGGGAASPSRWPLPSAWPPFLLQGPRRAFAGQTPLAKLGMQLP